MSKDLTYFFGSAALYLLLSFAILLLASCSGSGESLNQDEHPALTPSQDTLAVGWALLPDGSPSTCRCHDTPPGNSGAQWVQAPGLHSSCLSCHSVHEFVIDDPQAVCETCHQGVQAVVAAAGMPNCSSCHRDVHLPVMPAAEDCRVCHPAPLEDSEASWNDSPGPHGACMSCHEAHTFAISPPESVCANCHGALIEAEHAGGHPQCLDCHQNAHIPVINLAEADCLICHATPPGVSGEWAAAPGSHASCHACHSGTEHGTVPVPAESVCADCHGSLIGGGHAGGADDCLRCHVSPHLPAFEVTQTDCQICHATPPEDPAVSWQDVPGAHYQCAQCHLGAEHGNIPDPPDSVCAGCHAEIAQFVADNGGASCLTCHLQPHLPDLPTFEEPHPPTAKPTSQEGCLPCHPAPPDRPAESWDDAPFAHRLCLQCHAEPDHGDIPAPANSVCGICHQSLIDDGHQGGNTNCLLCHQSPHVPQVP